MKHFFSWLVGATLSVGSVMAQTLPPAAPVNLQGQDLKTWLRQNWYDGKRTELSYSMARGKMYNYVDNQDGRVVCVYSGYTESTPLDSSNTNPGVVTRINCEHTVPQSWFDEVVRMRSDIHHLFPTYDTWNSNRGSDPFAEIPDSQTRLWMRDVQSQTSIPTSNINEYSEDTNSEFEPREDHKGNLARAIFYFYTMHQEQQFDAGKGVITAAADLQTLYQWHLADPVDARERERNRRVAKSQGNFNPYIAYPDLVARAWGFPVPPTVFFAAATGSAPEGNAGTSTYTVTLSVTSAPTTPLTVDVVLDAANSTATPGQDFTFTSPQTVTFAAGQTTQTVTVTLNGDTQQEANEIVVLSLRNPSTGGAVGGPATHELTITNDDGTAPTIAFASAAGSAPEGNAGATTTYTVNVTLSGSAPTAAVTIPVTVSTTGTTATSPSDYTLNTTSLTFAAGQASQTQAITLTVVGDTQPEPNETVRLVLGTPTTGGAVLGTPSAHVLTIQNDDQAPAGSPCTDLFFSEYAEGKADNTKVLEIFNPSSAPISLEGMQVRLYPSGSTTASRTANLSGTIAPGDVYVIANTGVAANAVKPQVDLQSEVGFFSGPHSIALFDGVDTLDVIGIIGRAPSGDAWTVPGGSTRDNTLVRKRTVSRGQTRWSLSAEEWDVLGTDVFTNVGSHTSNCTTVTSTASAAAMSLGIEAFPNPAGGSLQVRLPGLRTRQQATISLYNALGQQVLSRSQSLGAAETATLDVQSLANGLYSVQVQAGGVITTSRVVVQH
ncbi:T9SS C-terminal target domain-containing protein [Hymenobacter sediminis]|uniref:endonuclease n=1 Tax=Hymenobacter sediminis TaxID=2218621 RepID=UPI000DA6CAEE|nr:endonuclease [Hymenobacter sediminis]RPD45018.1 T9SS C-terminal target domain-containing protein [Hymenobacter sediminis]